MYITKLNLENFKSYINQEFEFKNITLLTGLNSAGKSSIFQSIRMFWSYVESNEPILNSYGQADTLKSNYVKDKFFQISLDVENQKYFDLKFDLEDNNCIALNKENNYDLNISYISANRLGPTEFQHTRNSMLQDLNVGINGEYTLDILSKYAYADMPDSFRDEVLEQNTLLNHVEKWLQEVSPNIKLQTELNKKMNLASFTINGHTPLNVGFGISYTLSIITQLLYSVILLEKQGIKTVLLMENPEAHLHPKGQTKIAELIAKIADYGVQIIVETHSDYILDGLRLSVKNEIISHEDTKLYYLELDKEGNTEVKSPQIDKEGFLDEWPENFFDTSIMNKMNLA